MVLMRAVLVKIMQVSAIGALTLGIVATFLLSYSYVSGDHQDRAEMIATAESAMGLIKVKTNPHTQSASFASEK
jgi:hypothetical protein